MSGTRAGRSPSKMEHLKFCFGVRRVNVLRADLFARTSKVRLKDMTPGFNVASRAEVPPLWLGPDQQWPALTEAFAEEAGSDLSLSCVALDLCNHAVCIS